MGFQNNQHGLPGKIRRQKIIARFTTKLYTVFVYSLLQQLGYVTAASQINTCTLCIKCVLRGRLPAVQVYIEAKRKVSHSTKFGELSSHFQTY